MFLEGLVFANMGVLPLTKGGFFFSEEEEKNKREQKGEREREGEGERENTRQQRYFPPPFPSFYSLFTL